MAGRDYPRTWAEFVAWFPDDDACLRYLRKLRWSDGFACPRCGLSSAPYESTRGRLVCSSCGHQATVTAGTIFEKTRTPLSTWFAAAWQVAGQKNGLSAMALKQLLGLGSYQTAWTMLHKLRRAMVRPERERLRGVVEVDENYVGGSEAGVHGRHTEKKAIVAIAVEVHEPRGFGRARLRRVPDASAASLLAFVREAVAPGAQVRTDGWSGYNGLSEEGYVHTRTLLSSSGDPAHVSMPAVHRVASLLKRWLLGTHQGSVRVEQLDRYLDEFSFRFNRRSSRSRGLLFYRLLAQAVVTDPAPYRDIIAHEP